MLDDEFSIGTELHPPTELRARVAARLVPLALCFALFSCHTEHQDVAPESTASAVSATCFGEKVESFEDSGVFVTDLAIHNVEQQPPGPEVLLVNIEGNPLRSDDGRYKIFVQPLSEAMQCRDSKACEAFVKCFGSEPVIMASRKCSAAFVGENDIVTAAHCVIGEDWDKLYGIIGYQAASGWEIRGGYLYVPAEHMVRACHVHECTYSEVSGPDFMRIHVCPVGPSMVEHGVLDYAKAPPRDNDPIVARTHALGLPAKGYSAKFVGSAPPGALFTNMGAGSGGVVVNGNFELVGVIRGYSDHSSYSSCTTALPTCWQQRITWIDTIRGLQPGARCDNKDEPYPPYSHDHDCLKDSADPSNPKSE